MMMTTTATVTAAITGAVVSSTPYTHVDSRGPVIVDAPFTHVGVSGSRVRVIAPFVNLSIPR